MPIIGEIRKGREIGKKSPRKIFIWAACEECSKERWVKAIRGIPVSTICFHCAHSIKFRAENNPNWKGGQSFDRGGYIRISMPNHPRTDKRGYVLEHIWVWEKTHNKPLPEGYIVHHLNGIKDDNRPQNLFAMPKRKHTIVFHLEALQHRIRELEIENKLLEKALGAGQMIFRLEEN